MGRIDEITQAIDDYLIETDGDFLTLAQANKFLANRAFINEEEKNSKFIKQLLEENGLPQAYKTETSPRQWHIPLSHRGIERKSMIPKQCATKEINVGKKFTSPKSTAEKSNSSNILIGIVIFMALFYVGVQLLNMGEERDFPAATDSFSNSTTISTSNSTSSYIVNNTTYATVSKASFNKMFDYLSVGDNEAISTLIKYGQIVELKKGTEVYLVSAHLTYKIVRLNGSLRELYVVSEHISSP